VRWNTFYTAVLFLAVFTGTDLRAQAPVVTASVASLSFAWQQGAALPAAQAVALKVSAGTPAYVITTPAANAWLIATPDSGNLPVSIAVQVNPNTLASGVYASTVTITTAGAAAPVNIAITLTVTSSSTGVPVVAPAAITLTSPGLLTGAFTITGSLVPSVFTASSGSPWLTVSLAAGALLPAESEIVTVTANPVTLAPQTTAYAGIITVITTSNGVVKSQTVTVNLTVKPMTPVVSSVWPQQIPVGSPDTQVTIRGANFYVATTVSVSPLVTLKTTLIGSDVLLVTIPAPSLAVVGSVSLTVANPSPGGAATPIAVTIGNASIISGIANGASFATGSLSRGEIVAIFGQNLGPSIPVQLTVAAGFAQTSLGGVTVTISGQPAPIVYASSMQLNVQVPYNSTLGTAALGTAQAVTVTYGTATPASAKVDIVAGAPGLFTLNGSGSGAALVLNFDTPTATYSVNSSKNAAAAGSTIVFFLTGEGDYASAAYPVETGFLVPLTPPVLTGLFPQLNPLPTVTIGGVAATSVTYAGPIPGDLLGLLQINAVVPTGAAIGPTAPLSVTVGALPTQANVTISLK
jgi:uncharacterized protein (TIGR03437 family)